MSKPTVLEIPGTQFSMSKTCYISMLEEAIKERIGKRIELSKLFCQSKIDSDGRMIDTLCIYTDNPYSRTDQIEIITTDAACVFLWKCYMDLKKYL